MTTLDAPADTRMMGIVHSALQRDLLRAREVLAAAPPPTGPAARALGGHVTWMMEFLHAHHSAEDEGLWPLVRQRNPAAGDLLDSLEADHARIAPAADAAAEPRPGVHDHDDGRTPGGAGRGPRPSSWRCSSRTSTERSPRRCRWSRPASPPGSGTRSSSGTTSSPSRCGSWRSKGTGCSRASTPRATTSSCTRSAGAAVRPALGFGWRYRRQARGALDARRARDRGGPVTAAPPNEGHGPTGRRAGSSRRPRPRAVVLAAAVDAVRRAGLDGHRDAGRRPRGRGRGRDGVRELPVEDRTADGGDRRRRRR